MFRQTIFDLELCELEAKGQRYTWMNEHEDENAFVQGRNITDNILLAHEIFDILRKKGRKKGSGALKIDMCKAYDGVNWNFHKTVLISMNFSNKWVNWVMQCVTSVQFSLLINCSPSKPFNPSRG